MNFKPDSKILIQGITEPLGSIYAPRMKAYGTNVVAGVSVGKGGQLLDDIPIFDLVDTAITAVGQIDTTIIFVEPYWAVDAALEAIASGIRQIILVTGGIPPLDMIRLKIKAEATGTFMIGPCSSGIILPEKVLWGTHETEFYAPGYVGLLSYVDTLTYEVAWELTQAGLGQSIGVSLGNDALVSSCIRQWLKILDKDDHTKAIVLVGHTGFGSEEADAEYIASEIDKPVVAYFVGRHAPQDRQLGNAISIISHHLSIPLADMSVANRQIAAFKQAKIPIAKRPSQIPDLLKKALKK